MDKWNGKYKCRLCGNVFNTCMTLTRVTAKKCVIGAVLGKNLEVQQPGTEAIHCCDDGSFGVADFLGMKKEEE